MIRFGAGERNLTGPRLAAMRRLAKWTQQDLARRAGVHPQTVKYWERQPGPIAGHAPKLFLAEFAKKRITVENVTGEAQEAGQVKPPATCQAKTRKGTPCRMQPAPGKKRCKLHGGMSTGPKTVEGRQAISRAQKARWQASRSPVARPATPSVLRRSMAGLGMGTAIGRFSR
jgi:DNA-binding XRE family transcriptional regulator